MWQRLAERYSRLKREVVVQQRRPHEYFINRYYAHVIDPFFTKLAYELKMSPNAVTLLAALTGISAGLAFGLKHWATGAILLQLHHFLDGADGNLARLTGRATPFGARLDRICDQLVRLTVFTGVAVGTGVPLWTKIGLLLTIYVDLLVVHAFVLPFAKKYPLRRARWKQWFLDRGLLPGFDIFTVYFLISLSALTNWIDQAVYLIIVLKNWDWLYRVWECVKTMLLIRSQA